MQKQMIYNENMWNDLYLRGNINIKKKIEDKNIFEIFFLKILNN